MKKIFIIAMMVMMGIATLSSCKKYLDINSDPDTPQFPDVSSVFPTQLAGIPRGLQYDSRYCGRFIQNWLSFSSTSSAANVNFDRMGYTAASDANGDIWRQVYFGMGKNLNYIIDEGLKKQQWDYVGAAYALKAMMFQYCTDYHGDIIYSEAFAENQASFKFDDQQTVYKGVDSLCRLAINYLSNTAYSPTTSRLAKGDYIYNGSTDKWLKFTYGLLARNFHRITNKSTYNADSVIYYCDKSMALVDDDFVIPFDASKNDDTNFYGTYRDNLTVFRQSNYIVKLLDGSILSGVAASSSTAYNRDPRMKHMLTCSQDTTNGNGGFRGVDPGAGDPGATTKRVSAPWADSVYANPSSAVFSSQYKRYLFADKVVFPVMTASEIQFMKAEAAFRKTDKATALAAYTKGINLHFDFINRTTFPRGNGVIYNTSPISASERNAYLNGNDVRRSTATLNLSDIMLQKYIALWGWGFFETFVDMRRFHYIDLDPATGTQVYLGFALPTTLAPENLNKPVYRVRPRYNSEYVWNRDELLRIGALNGDYHTYECWFSQP
ncbi:SusD/RagB family nutrient-binding outer membrane lipoprotein [Ferruginibacter profundus]